MVDGLTRTTADDDESPRLLDDDQPMITANDQQTGIEHIRWHGMVHGRWTFAHIRQRTMGDDGR